MAAFQSPLKKPKKPTTTAYDALKPTTVPPPSAAATPQPYFPKQVTATSALGGGTPQSTVPEAPPNVTLPGKPAVAPPPTPPPTAAPIPTNPPAQVPRGERPTSYTAPDQGSFVNIDQRISEATANYEWVLKRDTGMTSDQIAALQQQFDSMTGNSMAAIQAKKQIGEKLRRAQEITNSYNQEVSTLRSNYERKGKYEQQINQFNQYVQDELKKQGIPIPDAGSVQNNPAYQAAIEAMKGGKSLEEAAALFRQGLPNNYNFQVGGANFTPNKGTIGDVTQTNIPNINKGEQINVGGTMINRTDLEALLSGDNNLANKASGAALESLMQTLKNGGALTPEQLKQLTDPFNKDSMARQSAAESNAMGALSARGFGTNAAAVTGSLSEIGRGYEAERTQKEADILKQNLMAGIEGKQKATQGLADLAASERQARINAAEIGSKENIAQAGITSEEKQKQADLQFAQDELYQNGMLSQAGLQLKQNLETYGLQLDKYKTDQGFDLEMAKQDLTQRLAQSGLDVDSAKLQADNVFKSLDVAIADKKIDAEVNTAIAELQQRAASGDRDAQFKVDSLRVEQNLRQQGLDHDLSMFTADLAYKIQSGRERLDAEMFMFLKQLDAKLKEQNRGGGLGGFLGKIIGTVVGAATGGVGGALGGYIADELGLSDSNKDGK